MNRNSFLKLCLAAGSFLTAPFTVMANHFNKKRADKGIKVDAGKDRFGESISLFEGDSFFCKVSTKDTDGDVYIFESTRDKKGGPPLHYHFEQDEWWYILEGEFLFKVGDQTFTAKAGDSVFGPRMIPHAFAKTNEGASKLLMAFQPAGKMEEHFRAVSKGIYAKMTKEEKDKFQQGNGFKVVEPALTHDKTIQQ
jgi:mannose-6-phosphate isomerase-like protein (cupin superfamily)